jgi:hypothetical protein
VETGGIDMTWQILAPRVGKETAEALQSYMNLEHPIERNVKINWGNSYFTRHVHSEVWGNKCESVGRSVNKQIFFDICKDLGTVPLVYSYEGPCFQHTDTSGHNGSGVSFVNKEEDFLLGVLSTKQIKGQEFRVYFCYNMEPMIYAKVPLTEETPHNPIQNSFNGYGYMKAAPLLKKVSGLKTILVTHTGMVAKRLELYYGAVDFIMSEDYTVYILETNTAPTLFSEELCENFATNIAGGVECLSQEILL